MGIWLMPSEQHRRDATGSGAADEHRHLFYLPRLVAFALIAVGIVDKNRGSTSRQVLGR